MGKISRNNYKSSHNIFNNQKKIENDNFIRLDKMKNSFNNFEKIINFKPNKDSLSPKNYKKLGFPPNYNGHIYNSLKRINIVNNINNSNYSNKFEDNINLPQNFFHHLYTIQKLIQNQFLYKIIITQIIEILEISIIIFVII